jgi:hypothetical protein
VLPIVKPSALEAGVCDFESQRLDQVEGRSGCQT